MNNLRYSVPGWDANDWAIEAAKRLAIFERDWKRHVGKYTRDHQDRFSAYHSAAMHAEKELVYWRGRVAEIVEPWFDGSAFK